MEDYDDDRRSESLYKQVRYDLCEECRERFLRATRWVARREASRLQQELSSAGSDSGDGPSAETDPWRVRWRSPRAPASDRRLRRRSATVSRSSLDAGIDVRRVWRGEVEPVTRGGGSCVYAAVADRIDPRRGVSLDDAIADQAPTFPRLLVEMTRVGELTGTTPEVYRRLAEHYDHRVARTRDFSFGDRVAGVLQLVVALVVVGCHDR